MEMNDSNRHDRPLKRKPHCKLRRERELRGWSQADVAKKIGAQPRLITRWETGSSFPSPYYRQKLCQLYGKSAEELDLIKETPVKSTEHDQDRSASGKEEPQDRVSVPGIQPDREEHEEHVAPLASSQRRISRKTLLLVAGGLVLGTASGLSWWIPSLFRSAPPRVRNSLSPLTTLYTYQPPPPFAVNYVHWAKGGKRLVCAIGDKTVQILNALDGTLELTYREHHKVVNCAKWSPDTQHIASCGADSTVQIWNPRTGQRELTYQKHTASVLSLSWSPDGSLIASCGRDQTVHIWDFSTGAVIQVYRGHSQEVWGVAWSPDSLSIASCGADGTIQVWNPRTGKQSDLFRYSGPQNATINQVDWSPSGSFILSAHANGQVFIWDAVTGTRVILYENHSANVLVP